MFNRIVLVVTLFGLLSVGHGVAFAQDSNDSGELLAEMRRMRQSVEDSIATNLRLQIVLAKLQRQDSRIARAEDRLEDARSKLTDIVAQVTALDETMRRYEDSASAARDPKQREGMAAIVRESQTQKIRLENERLLAQGGETDAENRLIAEQSELTTLSRQLEQIERQVKGAQPKD